MDNEVTSTSNDTVVIMCKRHDNDNNTFILNPTSVILGKINSDKMFESEDGKYLLPSIDDYNCITSDEYEEFYAFPISIKELTKKYEAELESKQLYSKLNSTTFYMMLYFKEIASKLLLAVKDDNNFVVKIFSSSFKNVSKDITGDVTKKIGENNKVGKVVAYDPATYVEPTENDYNEYKEYINNLEMEKYLKERIIENDSILEDICTTIAMNSCASNPDDIEAILSVGPTGSGKTETFKLIAEYLGIPITIYDCNALTAAGYVGKDIEDVLTMVLMNAGGDIDVAQRSILVLDEIDKIAAKAHQGVGDIEVQNSLLKVLDGHKFDIEINKRLGTKGVFDTSFLTIVGLGAFPGLFEAKKPSKHFGLGDAPIQTEQEKEITTDDFVNFGMLAELMGRFHNIYFYKELDKEALKRILVESKNSPLVRKAIRLKNDFNIDLSWDEEFVNAVAEYAYMKKAGGRSLNKIVSNVFKKIDRDILIERAKGNTSNRQLVLTKKMLEDNKSYKM